jgi:hypothetical protein
MNTKNTLRKENELIQLLKRVITPSISGIKITPLAGDASNRNYFRVSYSAPSAGSAIVMILNKIDKAIVSEEIEPTISQGFTELPLSTPEASGENRGEVQKYYSGQDLRLFYVAQKDHRRRPTGRC